MDTPPHIPPGWVAQWCVLIYKYTRLSLSTITIVVGIQLTSDTSSLVRV